jgi:hypothetical protein
MTCRQSLRTLSHDALQRLTQLRHSGTSARLLEKSFLAPKPSRVPTYFSRKAKSRAASLSELEIVDLPSPRALAQVEDACCAAELDET